MRTKKSESTLIKADLVFEFIKQYISPKSYPPVLREMGQEFHSSTSVINYYLAVLEGQKKIERDHRVARGIRILNHTTPEPCPECGQRHTWKHHS